MCPRDTTCPKLPWFWKRGETKKARSNAFSVRQNGPTSVSDRLKETCKKVEATGRQ